MRRRLVSIVLAVALVVPALVALAATPASAQAFSNPASIALNDPNTQSNGNNNATAAPYPSTIAVSGLTGTVNHVDVTLSGVSYSHSQDIDVLLVGPGGQSMIVVANLGPDSGPSAPAANSTLTLSDAGVLPPSGRLTPWGASNTFKPVNFGGFNEVWEPPAPAGPYGDPGGTGTGATFASIFNGTNPNGTWSLYVITTAGGDGSGAFAGGWSLNITTASVAATTTTVSSNPNPSFTSGTSSAVTLTATVHKASDSSNVNEGTVTFTDGGNPIAGCTGVTVSSGQATCTPTFATEGDHTIVANYSGTANFGASHSAILTQVVNNHTTVTGSNFCNTGSLTLNNPTNTLADATPYPSNLFVSGLSGTVNHVAVTFNNVSYSHSQDIDALLVGPGGQTLILVANLGPSSGPSAPAASQTVTFSDAGALPASGQATPWSALGTVKPVNYGGFNETWGPPAPPGPLGDPGTAGAGATLASQFNGINGNGTWSLYVITTAGGDGTGAFASGWCANITTAAVAASTTALASNNNPSFTAAPGNAVTFTATVHKASDASAINEGTVTFTDGGNPIGSCSAVNVASGQATCATTFSTEGNHSILAQYNGTTNFGPSSDTVTQVVNNHTGVSGNNFCNTGSIALNNPPNTVADATPYPSNIFVTGRPGALQHLTVTLNNVSYSHSQDIDALLVGPGGQTLILVANLGPGTGPQAPASGSTLTLDDAGILPPSGMATPWGAASTFKPVNYGGFNQVWGPPAPPGPYGDPGTSGTGATLGSVFNGIVPNGKWSLYVITTASGDGSGAIAGGWCLGVTSPQPPTLTKVFAATAIPQFSTTSLSFTVTNPNASTSLSGIGFTDTLPSGLIFPSSNIVQGCGGGTITVVAGSQNIALSGATLPANGTCSFSVPVKAVGGPGSYDNVTSPVNSTEGGAGSAATATLVVAAPPTLDKSFGTSPIAVNGTTNMKFFVGNPNSSTSLSGVGFTDTLPAGLVINTGTGTSTTCGGGTLTVTANSVALTGASLSANGSCTINVTVTGTTAGDKVNTTSAITSTEGGNGSAATATVTVTAGPPQITKSFGAATIPLNGSTTLSFTITNPAANGTSTGIGFTDSLPAGLVVSTPNGVTGSCGGGAITATAGAMSVSLANATLTAGASCTFSVNVTGTTAGAENNSVTVSSANGGTGNTSNASVTVVAPPSLTKSFDNPTIALNGSTNLQLVVTNHNASTALSGVGFSDTLPAGLVLSTPSGTLTCDGGTFTIDDATSTVSLAGATLPPNASCVFNVTVTGTTAGAKVNTTGVPTSNQGGNGTAATATLTVSSGPVQITKSFAAASIPLGASTTLSFTITNPAANGTSTGIGFADSLPSGLVVSSPNGLAGSCGGGAITATAGAMSVSLANATLTAGASCMFSVSVTGASAGVKNNSVTVSSTNGGTGNTSNATVTVVAPPSLAKQFGAATIPLNGSTTLTFTAANPNSSTSLSGVGFTDTLPAGLVVSTPNGLSGSCGGGTITAVAGSSNISLSGASLTAAPAAGSTCTFSVNVTAVTPGVKVNTTSVVTSGEGGTGTPATAAVTVVAPPQIAKSFSPTSVALNGTSTLSFTITNPNASTALTGVGFTDTLPSGVVVSTPNGLTGSCGGGTITAVAGATSVSLAGATLAGNASCTFSVSVTVTTSGAKTNSVTVTSTNGGPGNTATATLTAALPPTITKSFAATSIPLGASTTLSFTVANPAGNQTLTGVAFADSLPAGLVVSTPNGLAGSCGGGAITATAGATSVSLAGATLTAGASCMFSVSVTGASAGVKNNSVTVSSSNGGTGNTSNATLTVVAPPSLAKQFGAATIPLNGSTTLTFTVANPNSSTSLSGVGFTDTLPAGLVVSTPNGLSGSCGGGTITAVAGSSSISLAGASLTAAPAAGSTCTFSVNVTATAAGAKVNTTSTVSSNQGGAGNPASANLTVLAPPIIAKSFGATNIALNATTSLSFTITNPAANPAALTGVGFTDMLPSGVVVSTPNGLTGSCGGGTITAVAGATSVSLAGATLAANASCTFSVNVTATTSGIKANSVTVSSTNGGTGNTATATLAVALPPVIAKSFGAATVARGASSTLTFTVANPAGNGTFTLTGVAFTDTLPAGLVVSTPNGLTGSCGGGTITAVAGSGTVSLANATLAGGASCTFSVKVTGTTAGVKNNSVTVTSANAGPGNTATASITVLVPPTIAKAFAAPSIPFGQSTKLTFSLTNPNTTVALTGVGFTDTLPAGLVVSTPNGLTGSCGGGTIGATAGSGTITLNGATLPANGSCTFAVNVTAVAVGTDVNTTSAVTSANGGTGLTATATLTVTRAPTTTTVTASPSNPSLGSPVTFTATVVPSGPNGSGINPTGTVSFFLDGQAIPVAVVPLSPAGTASFTTSGLGAGNHTVTARYSGDTNFLPSSSTTQAMVTVTCTTTITGGHVGSLVLGPGSTCVLGGTVTGSIIVPTGSLLDLEGVTVTGSINSNGAAFFRMCGSSSTAVTVNTSTGFVLIGDPGDDGCAVNTINGSLTLYNNTGGVEAIGNHVSGAVVASGNSGAGPFPEDTAPEIEGNGP